MIENAFGILSKRFRIFQTAITLEPNKVNKLVETCIVLHNMLRKFDGVDDERDAEDADAEICPFPGASLPPIVAQNPSDAAKKVREEFEAYFMAEGQVPWQRRMAGLE